LTLYQIADNITGLEGLDCCSFKSFLLIGDDKVKEKDKIGGGKTKIIWKINENAVEIESLSQVTAGDGARKEILENKDVIANNTTSNVFEYLEQHGIGSHFLRRMSSKSFRALICRMIPLEVVIRRIATGSYLKRNPEIKEGTVFETPVVEFYFKDDEPEDKSERDPFVVAPKSFEGAVNLYKPMISLHKPKAGKIGPDNFLRSMRSPCSYNDYALMERIARDVFLSLETGFKNITELSDDLKELVKPPFVFKDLKVEFGKNNEVLILADVIDNDSWRLEDSNGIELSKEGFRQGDDLETVKHNFEIVSKLTGLLK